MHWGPQDIDHNKGLDMALRLANAGTPIPAVLVLGAAGNVSPMRLKAASPKTTVIYRFVDGGNYNNEPAIPLRSLTYGDGYAWCNYCFDNLVAQNTEAGYADLFALYNEWKIPDCAAPSINEWSRGAMDAAYHRKRRITLYNFNPGDPPIWTIKEDAGKLFNDFWKRPTTIDNLRQARDQGHAVALHGYDLFNAGNWTGEVDCFRHEIIYDLLPADLQTPNLLWVITEFGDGLLNEIGSDVFLTRARGARDKARQRPNMRVLFCIWTFGISSANWSGSNAAKHLIAYESFLREG